MISASVKPPHGILPRDMLPLGFGCGGILGANRRDESLRLLETALDCGITYFDTARMYGLGDAEGILGELMPRYRDHVVLASKAGILPTDRSILPRLTRRGVNVLRGALPPLKRYLAPPAPAQPRFGVFNVPDIRKSLETSLRRLRTDHLDIFLLHECTPADVANPALLDFLQDLKRQGKIREFGLATGIDETVRITALQPLLAPVVQIPNSIWNMNIRHLPVRSDRLTITHSCLAHGFHALLDKLSADNSLAIKWHSRTGVDPSDGVALAELFLAHALRANSGGVVLFSSSKPANIRANVKLVQEQIIDPVQIDGLIAFQGHELKPT